MSTQHDESEQAAFQDRSRGDAWRYFLAWAFVCGYTLRMMWRIMWGVLCLAPWVPLVAIVVAFALTL